MTVAPPGARPRPGRTRPRGGKGGGGAWLLGPLALALLSAAELHDQAVSLDGDDDFLWTNGNEGIDLAGQSFTLSAWVRHGRLGHEEYVMGQGEGKAGRGLHFGWLANGHPELSFYGDPPCISRRRHPRQRPYLEAGVWHHWAATYDTGLALSPYYRGLPMRARLYMDGDPVGACKKPRHFTGRGDFFLGKGYHSLESPGHLKGLLDEARVWRGIAMTRQHIKAHSVVTGDAIAQHVPKVGSLVGYWRLNDAPGQTAVDASGKGHDLTLVHSPRWVKGMIVIRVGVANIEGSMAMDASLSPRRRGPGVPHEKTLYEYQAVGRRRRRTRRLLRVAGAGGAPEDEGQPSAWRKAGA